MAKAENVDFKGFVDGAPLKRCTLDEKVHGAPVRGVHL